jgi:LPXTG-motif cell wall-anchored protein
MRAGLVVVSVLVLLVGGVFAGQGLGFIPGSFMTGDMKWFWIGAVMVVVGLALGAGGLLSGRRRQSRV